MVIKDKSLLVQPAWRIIDQSSLGTEFDAVKSFAMDDTLCASVGGGLSPAVARTWVHHHTIVLGIQDTRLPFLQNGIHFLNERGYKVIVRNSGGLAVMLDEGVLNVSLVFPETSQRIDINKGYDTMWELVKRMFTDFDVNIEAKEIIGSYCPGSYDLSIKNRKFAGISQRRIRNGVAVQIYLCINGSGSERASLLKTFYDLSKRNQETKFIFPVIEPNVMASLSELLGVPLTINETMIRLLRELQQASGHIYATQLESDEVSLYESYLARVTERNDKIFEELK